MMRRVFRAFDKFVLEGRGIVLTGGPHPDVEGKKIASGTKLELRVGDDVIIRTQVADFELMRNCWSPHLPRPFAIFVGVPDFELPKDAEVWVEELGIRNNDFV
jgi:hypothetical protein